jgi:hypothetical protein
VSTDGPNDNNAASDPETVTDDGEKVDRRTPVFLSSHDQTAEVAAVRDAVRVYGFTIGHCDPSDHSMAAQLRSGWLAAWQGPVLMTPEVVHRLPGSQVIHRHAYVVVNGRVNAPMRKDAAKRGVVQFVSLPMPGADDRLVEILRNGNTTEGFPAVPSEHGHEMSDPEVAALEAQDD